MVTIYGLFEKATPTVVRYIGRAVDPQQRLYVHVWAAKKHRRTHKDRWIASMLSTGGEVGWMAIASAATHVDAYATEKAVIKQCKALGWRLVNGNDGGIGQAGLKHSDDTKRRMSETQKGRPQSKQHTLRSAAARTGVQMDASRPRASEQRSETTQALHRDEGEDERRREGKKLTPEHRANIGAGKKGKPWKRRR